MLMEQFWLHTHCYISMHMLIFLMFVMHIAFDNMIVVD